MSNEDEPVTSPNDPLFPLRLMDASGGIVDVRDTPLSIASVAGKLVIFSNRVYQTNGSGISEAFPLTATEVALYHIS
jgi:hypothetical protein